MPTYLFLCLSFFVAFVLPLSFLNCLLNVDGMASDSGGVRASLLVSLLLVSSEPFSVGRGVSCPEGWTKAKGLRKDDGCSGGKRSVKESYAPC